MFALDKAVETVQKFVEFYEAGKMVVALCHGVAILKYARFSNSDYLAKGKTITGFANIEKTLLMKRCGVITCCQEISM